MRNKQMDEEAQAQSLQDLMAAMEGMQTGRVTKGKPPAPPMRPTPPRERDIDGLMKPVTINPGGKTPAPGPRGGAGPQWDIDGLLKPSTLYPGGKVPSGMPRVSPPMERDIDGLAKPVTRNPGMDEMDPRLLAIVQRRGGM